MCKKGFYIEWSEVEEMMHYLGESFDMVTPDKSMGCGINLEELSRKFTSCADACKHVTSVIERPKISRERNMMFFSSVIFYLDGGDDAWIMAPKVVHSAAFALSVLLLAKINPLIFADYFKTFPIKDEAEDKRAMAVVAAIKTFAKGHNIPLDGSNNCGISCSDCP